MTAAVVFLWASLNDRSAPPSRVQVEVCTSCKALVLAAEFDTHGAHHAEIERVAREVAES